MKGFCIKQMFAGAAVLVLALVFCIPASAQGGKVTATLQDAASGEAIGFATVSLTKAGSNKAQKYALSDDKGRAVLEKVSPGTYTFKAEILGYKAISREVNVKGHVDLGVLKMETDRQVLEAASVSAAGNPIIIKKDTVEYNASSFKTTDNDMLEDLLKKLPGIEVGEDGSITSNGKTISKITIDGKTFFLDDPQLASKNIPAKAIQKLKVVDKKSEQAQFTGIDDGDEETIIDLSFHPGMKQGSFGNVMLGGGHDVPAANAGKGDYRFQGAAFAGKFADKSQISIILNGNNTNNRGFNDLAGGMMQGMRGGGGGMGRGGGGFGRGNGITTSWMGGVNGAFDLFDDKMKLEGNYLYNGSERAVEESSYKVTYRDDGTSLINSSDGWSNTNSYGNRIGFRIDHKFSENTSILFQPQVNWGRGNFNEYSDSRTWNADAAGNQTLTNEGFNFNGGKNNNWQANGFLLLRQKLGKAGRTLSFFGRYNFSNNDLNGLNQSLTTYYKQGAQRDSVVNQRYDQNSKSASLSGRLNYTEPLAEHWFLEGNYSFGWSRSKSYKNTYDGLDIPDFKHNYDTWTGDKTGIPNPTFSNNIENVHITQRIGATLVYQISGLQAQVGMSANPTRMTNSTTRHGKEQNYESNVVNWAPNAMIRWDASESTNFRLFYFGRSAQPSTSQLMPVPDNTNPLRVSFGNPYLEPYFNHDIRSEFRYSNRKKFTSMNLTLDGGMVQSPIVNATWTDLQGVSYSFPVNGPNSLRMSARMFVNVPVLSKNFTLSNFLNANYNSMGSYIGSTRFDMTPYYKQGEFDYDSFHRDYPNLDYSDKFTLNKTRSLSVFERIRLTWRNDVVELSGGAHTRMSKAWYTVVNNASNANMTWNNQAHFSMNWTLPAGLGLVSEFRYNWYNGYSTDQPSEYVLNATITKLLFKKKVTLAVNAYDILNQAKNLSVSDTANYHTETRNNTLGRYIVLSLTYRFGTFDASKMRGPGGRGPGGMGGPRR